tara:strand:+ start:556 stop:753 length:198 start_codon:yes stop_codon:yes gene_type:complete
MAFKVIVSPGAPDTSTLKGKRTEAGEDGVFEILCEDNQLEAFELVKGPGLGTASVIAPKKKKVKK